MKYFDTETRTETQSASSTTILSTDKRVSWWFNELEDNEIVVYNDEGMPYKTIVGTFKRPIVVDGEVVEGMSHNEILSEAKLIKKKEILKDFEQYKTRHIVVNEKPFYCSDKALTQYSQMYDKAISMELVEGDTLTPNGWINVTKSEMEEALDKIFMQLVVANKKLTYYLTAIASATTQEELDLIVWEDNYSGGA